MEEGRGKVTEGTGGTGQNMVWDGSKGKRRREWKGWEGLQPVKFNFWCHLCPVLLETLALYSYMMFENADVTKNGKRVFFNLISAILLCCHQTANNSKQSLYLYFRSELRCKYKL